MNLDLKPFINGAASSYVLSILLVLLLIVGISAFKYARHKNKQSRLYGINQKHYVKAMLLSILAAIVPGFFFYILEEKTDLPSAFSVTCNVVTILGFLLFFYDFQKKSRKAKVGVLFRENSSFNEAMRKEIEAANKNNKNLEFETIETPGRTIEEQHASQLNALKSLSLQHDIDAIVIRPIHICNDTINAIAECLKNNIYVLCVDTVVRNIHFHEKLNVFPFYVRSDFYKGGELLATHLIEKIKSLAPKDYHIITLTGPTSSQPGTVRSQSFTWKILHNISPSRLSFVQLNNWDRRDASKSFFNKLASLVEKSKINNSTIVIAYCGADSIALEISRSMDLVEFSRFGLPKDNFFFLGYDGIKSHGKCEVECSCSCIATVDVDIAQQAKSIVSTLMSEVNKNQLLNNRNTVITPILATFDIHQETLVDKCTRSRQQQQTEAGVNE